MNKYTSLKLSKLLADNGFEGESNLVRLNGEEEIRHSRQDNLYNPVPTYDILNDLCVKYAKEMFGEKYSENVAHIYHSGYCTLDASDNALLQIGILIRQDRQDEAEEYFWENCLFNPKNNQND